MPIQFVIATFQECSRFKFLLIIFSGQTLFRIQTRHFRSFLFRLVIAITMNLLPLFCLMKTIKYYNILLSFIGVLCVYYDGTLVVFSAISEIFNTSSPFVFSVMEMLSLLQVYATTGLNLLLEYRPKLFRRFPNIQYTHETLNVKACLI